MKNNILSKKEQGFTIIEVLIVLAIAGLIMLIVFLAVPALQRNSRNTQRSNDAARVAGAINECLANNNGNLTNCNNPGAAQLNAYITMAGNQQLVNWNTGAWNAAGGLDGLYYANNTRCNGNTPATGGGTRAFTLSYSVETSGAPVQRCVGS